MSRNKSESSSGSPRYAALQMLLATLESNIKLYSDFDLILDRENLDGRDRGLAYAIYSATLTRLVNLDAIISHLSTVPMKKIDPYILAILRTALWQIFYADRIPDFAAVDEAVNLSRKLKKNYLSAYTNGLLRSAVRQKDRLTESFILSPKEKHLKYSVPQELLELFISWMGREKAYKVLEAFNEPGPLSIRVNTLKGDSEALKAVFGLREIAYEDGVFMEEAMSVKTGGNSLSSLPGFDQGLFIAQDEAAMLVSRIAAPTSADKVADLCASPGGKACHMAALMKNEGEIKAYDLDDYRIGLLKENIDRLGVKNINYKLADARLLERAEVFEEGADLILADVPCSALGLLGGKPDIKHRFYKESLEDLYKTQKDILDRAAKLVKDGGRIVYSTCTLNPAENQERVDSFLQEHPDFEASDFSSRLPAKLVKMDGKILDEASKGSITLYPDKHKCDGFFIAVIKKKKEK